MAVSAVAFTEEGTTMLTAVLSINLALRFTLAMALLAALAVWAWAPQHPRGLRLRATVGLPIVAIAIWGSVAHGAGIAGAVQFATQLALWDARCREMPTSRRSGQPRKRYFLIPAFAKRLAGRLRRP